MSDTHDEADEQEAKQQGRRGSRTSDTTDPGELTLDVLFRCCQSKTQRPKKNEPTEAFLGRVSHVTLTNKRLTHLGRCMRSCSQMRVLYAYDNYLVKVEHLEACHNLSHLYLQNNELTELSGLGQLHSLSKLYLDGNKIQRVEGLENLQNLEELHVSNQYLPEGVGLEFDPKCLSAISRNLTVLNAARCGISDVEPLVVLSDLRQANLSGNYLQEENMEGLESALASMQSLRSLDLRENPICKTKKYRDNIILMSQNLEDLDDKPISGRERQFLLQLHIRKLKREQAEERRQKMADGGTADHEEMLLSAQVAAMQGGFNTPNPTPMDMNLPKMQVG